MNVNEEKMNFPYLNMDPNVCYVTGNKPKTLNGFIKALIFSIINKIILTPSLVLKYSLELEELKEDFNQQVHDFVKFSTENMEEKGPDHSNESWGKRKIEVIEKSKLASNDELLVMFADKLANIRSFVQDYKELGEKLWEKFNGNKEKQKWFYSSLYQIFKDKFGQNQEVKLFLVEFDEHVASLWPKS